MNKTSLITIPLLFFILGVFCVFNSVTAQGFANRLKGKILIQSQQHGEAWYVNPGDEKRYYLGRPDDAFNLMRELGVGITNENLEKIEIANTNLAGVDILSGADDNDNDGLSNAIEDSLGTDKNKIDTDGDGYNDKEEVLNQYNPNGKGKIIIDNTFASNQVGKILLQVKHNGEAWYVNPDNHKRYFLGRPADAFNIMKSLGLGITDYDLRQITTNDSGDEYGKYSSTKYNFSFEYVNFWPNSYKSSVENIDYNTNEYNPEYDLKEIFEYKLEPTSTPSGPHNLSLKIRIYQNNVYDIENFVKEIYTYEQKQCEMGECQEIKTIENYTNNSLIGKKVNIGNKWELTDEIYIFSTSDYIYYINNIIDNTDKREGSKKILQTFNTIN